MKIGIFSAVLCRMKLLHLAFLLAPATSAFAQTLNGPESVDCDTLTNTWYVGNTGSGAILQRTLPATAWQPFVAGLGSGPYGIEVIGDRLYACDGNRLKGFRRSDGQPAFNLQTNGTFLNGLAHDETGHLYATDFSGKKIFKFSVADSSWSVFVANTISTPNGIVFDGANNRLVYVSWGSNAKIYAVAMADSSVSVLKNTMLSNIDGIALDGAGRVYLASWGANAVHRLPADYSGSPELAVSGLNKPADIFYNRRTDTLGIPNSGNNSVTFAGFAPVSAAPEPATAPATAVFPNPAAGWLAVEWPYEQDWRDVEALFFTASGQTLVRRPSGGDADKILFDLDGLPAGACALEVRCPGRPALRARFVKR